MSIHTGHRKRVKAKFLESNTSNMYPHEILEFLLFFSIPRGDTNPIAHRLLDYFGSINLVFDARYEDLLKIEGIGENTATLLKSIPHLTREYLNAGNNNKILNSTSLAGEYLIPKFVGRTEETIILTMLDNKMGVIKCVILTEGSVNSAHLNTRKVVELCIQYQAATIVLAHNHPNGVAQPSTADIITTKKLKDALFLINVELVDHIIVANDTFISMADTNCI